LKFTVLFTIIMAAALNFDHKKKSSHHADRNSRDESSGMSASTKRHFDNVKRKMFAFVDRQERMELGGMHLAPPPPPFHHPSPPPPPMIFGDQIKAPRQPSGHRTPVPSRKHLQPPHQQLPPHLAFATPQVHRRVGKSPANMNGRLSPNVAAF
jgi:hypothetical protein